MAATKQKNSKPIVWGIVGAIIGAAVAVGITFGVLALCGAFNCECDDCPGASVDPEDPDEPFDPGRTVELKPIIYLYPENKMDVTVKLGAPEKLTASYPKYTDGWNVTAYPNGDLVDKKTGNKLYSLYWEGERSDAISEKKLGFVIKGEDSAKFLEEKLDILGLNYKEKEEFIVYWLPKLEANAYNYIYFASDEEIEHGMPLELSVKPDTLIRVRMVFKGLDAPRTVEEQKLEAAPTRKGFTVVEWGGIELAK